MNLKNAFNSTDVLLALLGQHNGIDTISDTTQVNKDYYSIQVVTDTVFSVLTENNNTTGGVITGVTIPAGTMLLGEFTSVKLTSGVVRAYKV